MMTNGHFIDFDGYLKSVSDCPDADFPFMDVALRLAEIDRPGLSIDRYRHELDRYAARAQVLYDQMVGQDPRGQVYDQYNVLLQLIVNEEQYNGDDQTYDHIDNTDITRVMDRRTGIPVALGLIYAFVAKSLHIDLEGIDFPGHFIFRLQANGIRLLFDPFDRGRILAASDLREWIKRMAGPGAELRVDYYRPLSYRGMLIRFFNNRKIRFVAHEDYDGALRIISVMRGIDQDEFRLLFDSGVVKAKIGDRDGAIKDLQDYLTHLPPHHPLRFDALRFLRDLMMMD